MKTSFCHYCALCGTLNRGPRTPNSSCISCGRSTYIQCPECNEPLLGKQFRCAHCQKQFTWDHKKPLLKNSKSIKARANYSIHSLEPKYARKIVADCKKHNENVLVVRKLSHLGKEILAELLLFNGDLHLPDVMTLQDLGDEVVFKSNLTFLYLDGLQDICPKQHEAYLNINAPISLCGLREIPPELAFVLKNREFPTVLNGISHLEQSAAELLATTPGKLRLDNLFQDDCHLKLQGRFFTNELKDFTDELIELSPTFARCMRESLTNNTLSLNGIKNLSATCANELIGSHDLHLGGITDLDEESAKELGHHKGALVLDSMTTATGKVFQSLTKNPKRISLRSLKSLPFDGLKSLEKRSNATLRLYSLKKLSVNKAQQLARLPVHIELDSGAALTTEAVEIIKDGNARFTIMAPESIDPVVMQRLAEGDVSNISVDTTTELQRKISSQKQNLIQNPILNLSLQKSFSEHDLKAINTFPKHLRIIFKETVPFDLEMASRVSQCKADFVFMKTGSLTDRVLSVLLIHSNSLVFGSFEATEKQCEIIGKEKKVGLLEIPLFLNFDLTASQINELNKNDRVKLK